MTNEPRYRRVLVPIRYPVGGIRTYILYNYPALLESGYRFTFVAPAGDSFQRFQEEVETWDAVEFVEASVVGHRCKLRATVRRLLKTRRFDLIHSQGFTAGVESVLANIGLGVPHIMTSHDVVRDDQFPGLRGRLKLHALGMLLSRIDTIVAVSNDARANHLAYLPQLRRREGRVITIRNGIDMSRFDDSVPSRDGSLRDECAIDNDVFLMGFLGRFMEQKGFLYLLDALDNLLAAGLEGAFHLLAVGSGDFIREYKTEIERRPPIASHITFLDQVHDVQPILRELDLLVMPSLWEACPLLPMEAMALGVPVLGTDCIGLREVLRNTPSQLVAPRDAKALSDAICWGMRSPWKEEAGRYAPVARERFGVQKAADALCVTFESLLTVMLPANDEKAR